MPGFVDWLIPQLRPKSLGNLPAFRRLCPLERRGYLSRARLFVMTRTLKSSYMTRTALCLCLALLNGCGDGIIYCEGEMVRSPDSECKAQLIQDVATDGTYAIVECSDWHNLPGPDWNAVVLKGTKHGLATKWLENRVVEIDVPAQAKIREQQRVMKGVNDSVEVIVRRVGSTEPVAGCGITGDHVI